MNKTSLPQAITPPEGGDSNLPVEAADSAPEIIQAASPAIQMPQEVPEWGDDRHYAQHWGLNE